jgi:hypothetical protein
MTRVFLSYSHKDWAFARRLRDDLRAAGLEAWTDEKLTPGTPAWKAAIEGEIERATCLVVTLSPEAKESVWVNRELDYASAQGKRIFPVLIRGNEKSAIPLLLISAQRVDARQDYEGALQELLYALYQHLGLSLDRLPTAQPPGETRTRGKAPLLVRRWWQAATSLLAGISIIAAWVGFDEIEDDEIAAAALAVASLLLGSVGIGQVVYRRWLRAILSIAAAVGWAVLDWATFIEYALDPYWDTEFEVLALSLVSLSAALLAWAIVDAVRETRTSRGM